jgi:hypothetical protein
MAAGFTKADVAAGPGAPATGADAPAFFSLLRDAAPRDYLGLRSVAFASGSILLHCLRLCGSQITREGLIRQASGWIIPREQEQTI